MINRTKNNLVKTILTSLIKYFSSQNLLFNLCCWLHIFTLAMFCVHRVLMQCQVCCEMWEIKWKRAPARRVIYSWGTEMSVCVCVLMCEWHGVNVCAVGCGGWKEAMYSTHCYSWRMCLGLCQERVWVYIRLASTACNTWKHRVLYRITV